VSRLAAWPGRSAEQTGLRGLNPSAAARPLPLFDAAWNYLHQFGGRDKALFQVLSVAMLLMGVASTAALDYFGYDILVSNYGNLFHILQLNWAFPCLMALIGVSCFTLNIFLGFRIWIASLRTWRVVPLLIVGLSLAGGGISLGLAGWYSRQATNLSLTTMPTLIWAWFAVDTASEAIATCALLWLLVVKPRRERRSLNLPTQGTLARLVVTAVETNLLSLLFHIVTMALFGTSERTLYAYVVPGE
jgi:hypothetical protein